MQRNVPTWQLAKVKSPHLGHEVSVITAQEIPYVANANRFQNLSIYLPQTSRNADLIGSKVASLPDSNVRCKTPRWLVHIHGGAWRDPQLTSASIEPTAACTFSIPNPAITAIISINYTVSCFPTHPTLPYDPIKDNHSDRSREAVHPDHILDVLRAFALLRSFGLSDDSFILSGHSCGACLALQASFQSPSHWGLDAVLEPPRAAALLGLNGLYDLPQLVHGLGESHAHLRDDYQMFLSNAFGAEQEKWPAASPSRFDIDELTGRIKGGKAPRFVLLDQSMEDQLVPKNQCEHLEEHLRCIQGMQVLKGIRCTGKHAAPWEQGYMIWESVQDVLQFFHEG